MKLRRLLKITVLLNIIDLINSEKKYEIKDGKLKLNLKGHEYKI